MFAGFCNVGREFFCGKLLLQITSLIPTYQISVEDPVGVQVVNPVEDLVQQRLHHPFVHHHLPLVCFGLSVEFDDVLEEEREK